MTTSALRKVGLAALGAGLAFTTAACSGDGGTGPAAGDGGGETITLGFIPSWTDGRSAGNLLKVQLEEMGYTVKIEELTEAGPLYEALAQGAIDIYPSAWPEVTHATLMDQYGDRLESLGAYYDGAVLTWAVPGYSQITSIADLPEFADVLDGRIIGIEPGAGLTEASLESVIPMYELDDFELVTSSTGAMLAELSARVDAGDEVVVTLWRPFWANATYDMRDLADPLGALGERESLHFLATAGFGERFPDVAEWVGQLTLDDAQYGSLESTVVNDFPEGQEVDAIHAWIEANPGVLP